MKSISLLAVAGLAVAFTAAAMADEAYKPKLFKQFGDMVNVPDGMALNEAGDLFLSAPNLQNTSYPGIIMKRCHKTGKWTVFTPGLIHPDTHAGVPMGMEFGPDGNLYYCDNQYFNNKNYKSRILRVIINEDGEPVRIEPVVENAKLANGIRIRGNAIFFSDTYFDLPGKTVGGIYRVPMSAFKDHPARLLPKPQADKDPYFLGYIETQVLKHRDDPSGADGICISKNGDIYTGTFGCGNFYKLALKSDGSYEKPVLLFKDPKVFPCCDGICYYAKKNWVIMTDSELNAVHYWDINKEADGKAAFGTLWANEDTTGADGLLDQPCEPIVMEGGQLVIANFDLKFPGLKNKVNDPIHTLSVISLK